MKLPSLANMSDKQKIDVNLKVVFAATILFAIINYLSGNSVAAQVTLIVGAAVCIIEKFILSKASVTVQSTFLGVGQYLIMYFTGFFDGRVHEVFPFFVCSLVMASLYFNLKSLMYQAFFILSSLVLTIFVFKGAYAPEAMSQMIKGMAVIVLAAIILAIILKYAIDVIQESSNKNDQIETMLAQNEETLASSQQLMNEQQDMITQIQTCSNTIIDTSDRMNTLSNDLSAGINDQEVALENLTHSITDISKSVKNVAEAASRGQKLSTKTEEVVQEGKQNMEDMLQAMNELKEVSDRINKVVKEIDNIAFQTNILALNAAVEAARAGVAGKGFAVVAEEVGNLASKSAESAKSTAVLMEQIVHSVDKGIKISTNAVSAFNSVVDAEAKNIDIMQEIASLSNHQEVSMNELTLSSASIESVVSKNKSIADECVNMVGVLTDNSTLLSDIIVK